MSHILFVNQSLTDILPLMPFFECKKIKVSIAHSIQEALTVKQNNQDISVIIADTELPDGQGVELLENTEDFDNRIKFFLAGEKSDKKVEKYLRNANVKEFLKKPISIDYLENILSESPILSAMQPAKPKSSYGQCGKLVGISPQMKSLYRTIERVAPTMASVLIVGESGTGKELVAEAIHQHSQRAKEPYIAINCGAISSELICSALFGHEKGSFTGAVQSHVGYFQQASGGTLFLDEITETSLDFQVKLLRVLETSTVIPVGGKRKIDVDVRIIASTNRCPKQAVRQGILREDLYYRLNVFPIHVPLLNQRENDVVVLSQYFLDQHNQADNRQVRFSPAALDHIQKLNFTGNVRELKNLVHRAYILADDVINIEHILHHSISRKNEESGCAKRFPIGSPLKTAIYEFVESTLEHYHNNQEVAADVLNISKQQLQQLMEEAKNHNAHKID